MIDLDLEEYGKEAYGNDSDDMLVNNSYLFESATDTKLTIKQIKELGLFINPLDGEVFSIQDGQLKRDNRYYYESY